MKLLTFFSVQIEALSAELSEARKTVSNLQDAVRIKGKVAEDQVSLLHPFSFQRSPLCIALLLRSILVSSYHKGRPDRQCRSQALKFTLQGLISHAR